MKIGILGNGNLAFHLAQQINRIPALTPAGIWARNSLSAKQLAEEMNWPCFTEAGQLCQTADVVFFCLSDDAIEEVSRALPETSALLLHCSGAGALDRINKQHTQRGVFYPLQTFSREIPVNWDEIPLFLEAANAASKEKLSRLTDHFGLEKTWLNSEQRLHLHLAAVMVNNFSNALFVAAADILRKQDLEFRLLLPLIRQTVQKTENSSPKLAQTGPARRHDVSVMETHLRLLEDQPELQEVYRLLSRIIQLQQDKIIDKNS